jgi:hypothetical protein
MITVSAAGLSAMTAVFQPCSTDRWVVSHTQGTTEFYISLMDHSSKAQNWPSVLAVRTCL